MFFSASPKHWFSHFVGRHSRARRHTPHVVSEPRMAVGPRVTFRGQIQPFSVSLQKRRRPGRSITKRDPNSGRSESSCGAVEPIPEANSRCFPFLADSLYGKSLDMQVDNLACLYLNSKGKYKLRKYKFEEDYCYNVYDLFVYYKSNFYGKMPTIKDKEILA